MDLNNLSSGDLKLLAKLLESPEMAELFGALASPSTPTTNRRSRTCKLIPPEDYKHKCSGPPITCCNTQRCEVCHVEHLHSSHDTLFIFAAIKIVNLSQLVKSGVFRSIPTEPSRKKQAAKIRKERKSNSSPSINSDEVWFSTFQSLSSLHQDEVMRKLLS